jgi:hypothetical protein
MAIVNVGARAPSLEDQPADLLGHGRPEHVVFAEQVL